MVDYSGPGAKLSVANALDISRPGVKGKIHMGGVA